MNIQNTNATDAPDTPNKRAKSIKPIPKKSNGRAIEKPAKNPKKTIINERSLSCFFKKLNTGIPSNIDPIHPFKYMTKKKPILKGKKWPLEK